MKSIILLGFALLAAVSFGAQTNQGKLQSGGRPEEIARRLHEPPAAACSGRQGCQGRAVPPEGIVIYKYRQPFSTFFKVLQ